MEQTLSALLPVVVGGLIAAGAGVLAALINHLLQRSREERALRRQRLETLVEASYEYFRWMDRRMTTILFQRQEFREEPPTDKLHMLVDLYFPELRPHLIAMIEAGLKCQEWTNAEWSAQNNDLKQWLDKEKPMDAYYPLTDTFHASVSGLTDQARKLLLS